MAALQLIRDLVANGKLTEDQSQTLEHAIRHGTETRDTHYIPGAITLRASLPTYAGMLAAFNVFNTIELLEQILLSVPAEDLLLHVQFVSKSFKRTIDDSLAIGREMFRQPDYSNPLAAFPYQIADAYLQSIWVSGGTGVAVEWLATKSIRDLKAYPTLKALLVMQPPPPIFSLQVIFYNRDEHNTSERYYSLRSGPVLTVGILLTKVKEVLPEIEGPFEGGDLYDEAWEDHTLRTVPRSREEYDKWAHENADSDEDA